MTPEEELALVRAALQKLIDAATTFTRHTGADARTERENFLVALGHARRV